MGSENSDRTVPSMSELLNFHNPWWQDPGGTWREKIAKFERPAAEQLWRDLNEVSQILW